VISYDINIGGHALMPDLLIRDVPEDVVAAVDAEAKRAGLSRSEYLRRLVARSAATAASGPVSVHDLSRFAETFADLDDAEVMRRAWQ
jgi:hypothetical protein